MEITLTLKTGDLDAKSYMDIMGEWRPLIKKYLEVWEKSIERDLKKGGV